jgi:hypothetical protein
MDRGTLARQEIEQSQWNPIFAGITRQYRGSHAKLEVFGPEVGFQVETVGRPFFGIAADDKDGEQTVWIDFGDLTHGVHGATAVRYVPRIGSIGPVIEIEEPDGKKTLLTLSAPEEYELPPAPNR